MPPDTDLRAHERTLDLPAPRDAALRFIGRIRTPFARREDCPRQGRLDGPECRIVLDEPWEPGLRGLEAFARIEVLYWLHESRRDLLLQNPRRDGRVVGTFALRSPVRPNPIGTALVALERIEGATLVVRGLDCLDGTPVLDIKPEHCPFGAAPAAPE